MLSSRIFRAALPAVLGAVLFAASISSVASAAGQRYASPSGSGNDCTSAKPCSLTEAVEHAVSGAEVIVEPGEYPLTTLGTQVKVTIHGVAGQPRPRLLFNGTGAWGIGVSHGSVLRYVELEQAP